MRMGMSRRGLICDMTSDSPAVKSYVDLFERLATSLSGKAAPLILVTSPSRGDGRTSVAANLALCATVLGGMRVLAIDADIDHPGLWKTYGLPNGEGLAEVLTGKKAWEDAVQVVGKSGPTLLSAGQGSSTLLTVHVRRFAELAEQWRSRFEWIVVDGGPVLLSAGTAAIGRYASGAILVLQAGRTRPEVIEAAEARLRHAQIPVLGAVLNRRRFMIPRGAYGRM